MPKRISVSISKELEAKIKAVKKDKFFDKSYAEMYRHLIEKGAEQCMKGRR